MRKVLVLSMLASSMLFATNGDNLIGLGVESRALGGTGIAHDMGAENALTNPALLGKMKNNTEFVIGGTYFDPTVKVSTTAGSVADMTKGVSKTSAEDASVIPAVTVANRLNENLVVGIGMYGTAGMGTDWRGTNPSDINQTNVDLYNMRSSLMLMQFVPSVAYSEQNYGIGLTGIIQYGSLSIDFDNASGHVGNGGDSDFGFGYQIGGYYDVSKDLTFGASYKSSIDMVYKDQISKAAAAFGYGSSGALYAAKSDHLEQPAEIGLGIAYDVKKMTYTADFKQIKWGDAKGYKDFGWENQNVLALGAKYNGKGYWYGVGYNHGNNPIPNNTDNTSINAGGNYTNYNGDTMNMFNYVMFPATIEKMYTIGGGKDISKNFKFEVAYAYAPEASDTVSAKTVLAGAGDVTTKHSQQTLSFGFKYKF